MNKSFATNVKQVKNTNTELCDKVWNPELLLELKKHKLLYDDEKCSYFHDKSQKLRLNF